MIKIANAQLWVHDQDEALAFYTDKLGWEVRTDVTLAEMGNFRWLTVGPAGQPDVAIVLMAIPGPPVMDAETAEQVRTPHGEGLRGDGLPHDRRLPGLLRGAQGRGVEFTEPPEERPYGIDSGFRDPSGNSIRLTQVGRWQRSEPPPPRAQGDHRLQRQRGWVLEQRAEAAEELGRLRPVEDAVVAGERHRHDVAGDGPSRTTGCSTSAPTARIAACGGLITAVKLLTPYIPRLETATVPPDSSGGVMLPSRTRAESARVSRAISPRALLSASNTTGTTSEPSPATATPTFTREKRKPEVPVAVRAVGARELPAGRARRP